MGEWLVENGVDVLILVVIGVVGWIQRSQISHLKVQLDNQDKIVNTARNALEMIEKDSDQFDLVITDMTMPKQNGDCLTQEILKIHPGMPIILCTGYSERISETSAQELGLSKYLEKPLDTHTLAVSVREVLDKKAVGRNGDG